MERNTFHLVLQLAFSSGFLASEYIDSFSPVVIILFFCDFFFFSSRRRHTRYWRDWSSDVCSSDLAVAEIVEAFRGSNAAVLTEYRGLTVAQITELRRAMGRDTKYAVVKNTLTKIAAREAGVEGIEEHLQGPTAVAFINGDPVEAAKGLRDFSRANPVLVIKGGVLDGKVLTVDEI